MLGRYKGSVANRIILWIVVFSIVACAMVTAVQVYFEQKNHIARIEAEIAGIERSYTSSVRRALWIQDMAQLQMLAEGIAAAREIAFVSINENGNPVATVGRRPADGGVVWETPITFEHRNAIIEIGRLVIVGDLARAREQILWLALRMLATNVAITLSIAVFVYFIFSHLVTRHLSAMAEQLSRMSGDDLETVLRLDRARASGAGDDEFDLLVSAFNGLRDRLRETRGKFKKGQEELRSSERRYRAILDEMLDTYYRTDNAGVVTMVTPSMYDLVGWRPQDAIGRKAVDFYVDPDCHARFIESFKMHGGSVRAFEAAMRHRDGRIVWISTTARIYRDDDGNIAGIEGIARDITEQRAAAEAVRRSHNQLRLVSDSVPALILYVDDVLKIRFANREAAKWLARDVEEIVGSDIDTVMDKTWVDRIRPHWEAALIGELQVVSDTFVAPDGKERRLELRLVPHAQADGTVEGFFALGLDMTERLMLEERLRQSQKMESVGQLTGGVAHDFNNLLGVILGNVEFLIEEPEMDAGERAPLLAAIQRSGERGARLTRQLLAFSRMQPLEPSTLNLDRDLKEFVSMLRPTIGDAVTVTMHAQPGLWPCMADRGLLELAILNLMLNARDAMPEGGEVMLTLANADVNDKGQAAEIGLEPGDYVMIAVSDSGKGIPAEMQPHVFEPFFTTKDVGRGTGLGLSMVYGFVSQSGGQVTLESEIGAGTTIRLYLPVAHLVTLTAEADANAAGAKRGICGRSERILVVEDDADLRALTATMLDRLGYKVMLAHDGPSALDLLESGLLPDIVLTDVRLPNGMLGPQVVSAAREIEPGIRAIYMTGFADRTQVASADLDGNDILIKKPFRSDDLALVLERVRTSD
ncbi:PAS domain S-box protein [Breoghania corrubedonensis]|nr:PAS domain S-box protein [Breoghania corrubedonensis]